jgi:hypothetical protein
MQLHISHDGKQSSLEVSANPGNAGLQAVRDLAICLNNAGLSL